MARILATFAAIALVATTGCDDPSYQGRMLSSWMHDLDSDVDHKRRQACEAIGEIGAPGKRAIPALITRLEDTNAGVREFAEVALSKMGPDAVVPLEKALDADEPMVRLHAAASLININTKHPKASAELINAVTGIGNAELSDKGRETLIRLGEPAVVMLIPKLTDEYKPVRLFVVKTVAKIGKKATAAVPTLAKLALEDKESEIRQAAIKAMAAIGPASAVESTFRILIKDEDEDVAGTAGSMLQYIGTRESATGTEGHVEEEEEESKGKKGKKKGKKNKKKGITKMEHLNIANQPADEE